ncbi:MAG: hypothetical protein Q4D98_04965 [Planctomycetia bacterium]|nr:hypothetical protein [Planctomycetia bacterium]
MKRYDENDFGLDYPDDWTVHSDSDSGCDGVTVEAPEGGFLTISRFSALYEPEELVRAAVDEVTREYGDCDVEPAQDVYQSGVLRGQDVDFLYLDLPCTVSIRAARHGGSTYVFYCQTAAISEDRATQFRAVTASFLDFLGVDVTEKPEIS